MLKNSLLLIIILYSYFSISISTSIVIENEDFKDNNFVAQLEIPKINLKKGLYEKNSILNDVDKNLMIIGDMPSENNKFIIAGHSGVGDVAYFNDLIYLNMNDKIIVYYNNKIYLYVISEIYEIKKTGKLYLKKQEKGIIVLITCKIGTDKQLVYKGILKSIE